MIKAVIFDCFGVLTRDKWKEFVATLSEDKKQPARDLNHSYDSGFINEREFITEIKSLTGRSPGEVENLTIEELGKNTDLLKYIAKLKPQYKIGIVSNIATNWVRDYFLTTDEQRLFDDMTFSFEVGATKPDKKIFEAALRKLGVKADESVLIDDQPRYCEAAGALGMKTVVYENFSQMKRELEKILTARPDN